MSGGATTTGTAMTEVLISPVVPHDVETSAGGGSAAPGITRWLGLAAAPTFALMALWTVFFSGQPDMLCMATQGSSPMSGMTVMYLLMSAFHSSPWLKLISNGRNDARRSCRVQKSKPVDKLKRAGPSAKTATCLNPSFRQFSATNPKPVAHSRDKVRSCSSREPLLRLLIGPDISYSRRKERI